MRNQGVLLAGLAGTSSLNLLHESARRFFPSGPHMDLIAMKAIGKSLQRLGIRPPSLPALRKAALMGDVLSNGLYYSLVTVGAPQGRMLWTRAGLLGLAAGLGAVFLPPRMGLGQQQSPHFRRTAAFTVGCYLAGALVAAGAYSRLKPQSSAEQENAAA